MRIALIRNNLVHNVIIATEEFAATLGYDLALPVTAQNRVAGGWKIVGVFYADVPESAETINHRTIEQDAEQALVSLRAYRDTDVPTASHTVATVKLLCRVVIGLIRLLVIRRLDGST